MLRTTKQIVYALVENKIENIIRNNYQKSFFSVDIPESSKLKVLTALTHIAEGDENMFC